MRKWLLMGVSYSLVAALVLVASAAAAKGKPHKAASRVTSALTVSVNQTTGIAKATGLVKVNGKKVPIRWHNVATRSDSWGNVCGGKVQPYTTSSFKAKDFGSYRLKFSLRTTKKYNGRYYTRTKTVTVDNDSDRAQCAALPAQPVDASSICAWGLPPANPDPTATYCGVPVPGAPAWLTPPSMVLTGSFNTIAAGSIGSKAGCELKPGPGIPVSQPWVGGKTILGVYVCSDGALLIPATQVIYSPDGKTQYTLKPPYKQYGAFATSFQFPANCKGELDVTFALRVQQLPNGGPGVGKNAFENAIFHLKGNEDCSQLSSATG